MRHSTETEWYNFNLATRMRFAVSFAPTSPVWNTYTIDRFVPEGRMRRQQAIIIRNIRNCEARIRGVKDQMRNPFSCIIMRINH